MVSEQHIRLLAHVPGDGLHFEVPVRLGTLWFVLSEAAMASGSAGKIGNRSLASTVNKWLKERGYSWPGGGPRMILPEDIH
jgi:hypothetical protein